MSKKDKGKTVVLKKKDKCVGHTLPVLVGVAETVSLLAGNKNTHKVPVGATLIDLTGGMSPPVMVIGFKVPSLQSKRVIIDWADMSTPALERKHWTALVDCLRSAKDPVFVGCMGGHGRTGTAVAILAHFLKLMPKGEDPVLWVREHYCPDAVETDSQVTYISDMTGRQSVAKGLGIKSWGYEGGKSGSTMNLCIAKPNNVDFCNLDTGHVGEHDTRVRAEILKERNPDGTFTKAAQDACTKAVMKALGDAKNLLSSSNTDGWDSPEDITPLSALSAPAKFCDKSPHCLLAVDHDGRCKSKWSGQYL